jgi:hypothetical protein
MLSRISTAALAIERSSLLLMNKGGFSNINSLIPMGPRVPETIRSMPSEKVLVGFAFVGNRLSYLTRIICYNGCNECFI